MAICMDLMLQVYITNANNPRDTRRLERSISLIERQQHLLSRSTIHPILVNPVTLQSQQPKGPLRNLGRRSPQLPIQVHESRLPQQPNLSPKQIPKITSYSVSLEKAIEHPLLPPASRMCGALVPSWSISCIGTSREGRLHSLDDSLWVVDVSKSSRTHIAEDLGSPARPILHQCPWTFNLRRCEIPKSACMSLGIRLNKFIIIKKQANVWEARIDCSLQLMDKGAMRMAL